MSSRTDAERDAERKEFEGWMQDAGRAGGAIERDGDDYADAAISDAWLIWRASRETAPTANPAMEKRPAHVRCIQRMHPRLQRRTWCGRVMGIYEAAFAGVDQAAENGWRHGPHVTCRHCAAAVAMSLERGQDDSAGAED